jgi:hypothetical protein
MFVHGSLCSFVLTQSCSSLASIISPILLQTSPQTHFPIYKRSNTQTLSKTSLSLSRTQFSSIIIHQLKNTHNSLKSTSNTSQVTPFIHTNHPQHSNTSLVQDLAKETTKTQSFVESFPSLSLLHFAPYQQHTKCFWKLW